MPNFIPFEAMTRDQQIDHLTLAHGHRCNIGLRENPKARAFLHSGCHSPGERCETSVPHTHDKPVA